MNLPEAQKRIEEINEQTGMTDPFPKFDQPEPPPPVEAPEPEQAPEQEQVEASEEETPEAAEAETAEVEAADAAIVEAEDDDIAWVRANKGFEVSDPIVAKTLRNQEEMIRRQGTEVGEARKRIEQTQQEWQAFRAQQEQMLEQQFEPDEAWEDWVDEGLLVDVQQTLTAAMEAGGDPAFNYAVSRWHLIDPVAATAFQIEFSKPEYHQPPAPASAQANDPDSVWARGLSRHPDLKDYEQAMTAVLESDPEIRERMYRHASIDPDAALDSLYNLVWRQQTDKQRSDALAKANAARAAQADASARDATVASATASAGHGEGRPLTEAEQVRANIRAELGLVVPD